MVTGTRIVAPLAGWNVRGYSYGEVQSDGQRHPGADLNVGYGDEDLGLDVVCFAAGVVAERLAWDGRSYGLGNVGLVAHRLFGRGDGASGAGEGEAAGGGGHDGAAGGVRLWSMYAHLDSFDEGFVPGARLEAGQRIGVCGKSGGQGWAHLHFELRYRGPEQGMPAGFWGGRLSYEAQSARYADPYTVLRLLEGVGRIEGPGVAELAGELAVVVADRDWNHAVKMELEHYLRSTRLYRRSGRRFEVIEGVADALIGRVPR